MSARCNRRDHSHWKSWLGESLGTNISLLFPKKSVLLNRWSESFRVLLAIKYQLGTLYVLPTFVMPSVSTERLFWRPTGQRMPPKLQSGISFCVGLWQEFWERIWVLSQTQTQICVCATQKQKEFWDSSTIILTTDGIIFLPRAKNLPGFCLVVFFLAGAAGKKRTKKGYHFKTYNFYSIYPIPPLHATLTIGAAGASS